MFKKLIPLFVAALAAIVIFATNPTITTATECPQGYISVGWPVPWELWPEYQAQHPGYIQFGSSDYGPHVCKPGEPTEVPTEEPPATEEPTEVVVTEEPTGVVTEEPTEVTETVEPTTTASPTATVITPTPESDVECILHLEAPISALFTPDGMILPTSDWSQSWDPAKSLVTIRLYGHGELNNSLFTAALSNGKTVQIQFQNGYADLYDQRNCYILIEEENETAVEPTTPTIIPCGEENCSWIEKAVKSHDVRWTVLAYCVNNPDPAVEIRGITLKDVQSGWVTVNGAKATSIEFFENSLFQNTVSGRWEYAEIVLGDKVQVHLSIFGFPVYDIDVNVVSGTDCGNPPVAAMIGPDGQLTVFPGQSPMDVAQITRFEGDDDELYEMWWNAHIAFQQGVTYTIPENYRKNMGLYGIVPQ